MKGLFNNPMQRALFATVVFAAAVGCQSSTSGDNNGTGGTSTDSGTLPPPYGSFTLTLTAPVVNADPSLSNPGYTNFVGLVRDGEVPQDVIWTTEQESSGCALLTPTVPFCSACDATSVCVGDEECQAQPQPLNLGAVTLSGVTMSDGSTGFSAEPAAPKFTYAAPSSIAYPPASTGTPLILAGDGGDYPAFELQTTAFAPLELLGEDPTPMNSGEVLPVRWTADSATTGARIAVLVNISHHGGAAGKILCDVEDTGSLDIPAALVTRLLELGYSGFPTVEVSRVAVDTKAVGGGTLKFELVSSVVRNLAIEGLTSCQSNADCTGGQTCLSAKQCG